MSKRVFLYVIGDDYSALHFEDNFDSQEVYEQMIKEGVTSKSFEGENYYISVYIKEFGEIDDGFISFVLNSLMDYDSTKHTNIYEVKHT